MPITGTGTTERTGQPCLPTRLLQMIASQLATSGLEVREHQRGGDLTEIAVTNPRHPETSRAIIDSDGFLTWERACRLRTGHDAQAVAHTIGTLLDDDMSQQHQPSQPQPVGQPPAGLSRPGAARVT